MDEFKLLIKDFWEMVVNINATIFGYLLIILAVIVAVSPIVIPILLVCLSIKYLF